MVVLTSVGSCIEEAVPVDMSIVRRVLNPSICMIPPTKPIKGQAPRLPPVALRITVRIHRFPQARCCPVRWTLLLVFPGKVRVPGSKSVSNRVLLLAALGRGTCRVKGLLHSDDTQVKSPLAAVAFAAFSISDER